MESEDADHRAAADAGGICFHSSLFTLESGRVQGANAARIARRLREELGGKPAHKRALRIVRNETTGALNGGQRAQQQTLEGHGVVIVKEWFPVGDDDTRETHAAASGQTVRGSEGLFIIGGFEARFPGDPNLPGHERINCCCAMLTDTL